MPIYEYQCPECGHKFERLQKFNDPAPDKCPECGHERVERSISTGTGFLLKGYGWHKPGLH
jgi:putative FmdB family regulatory protein